MSSNVIEVMLVEHFNNNEAVLCDLETSNCRGYLDEFSLNFAFLYPMKFEEEEKRFFAYIKLIDELYE